MMKLKPLRTQNLPFLSLPSKHLKLCSSSANSITEPESKNVRTTQLLTQQDITKINLLIPRLCLTNNIDTAINLTITALLTSPPLKSISFSILIHSLTSQPDLALPMSLLTKLKHTPQAHSHLSPITTLLVSSYLKKGRHKDALKVYNWMLRPASPCEVEKIVYDILVDGLSRSGLVVEALRVLRHVLSVNLVVRGDLRKSVFRSLLREARIKEAKELDEALGYVRDGEGEAVKKVLDLLAQMIANWTE